MEFKSREVLEDPIPMDGHLGGTGGTTTTTTTSDAAQQARWKTSDLLVLIAAKRYEAEKCVFGRPRGKSRLAVQRWKDVEDFCRREGVRRKAGQCKKRWEKLMTDFKKVYDYQKQVSDGQALGYFEQSCEEKKSRKLPLTFLHECYDSMVDWVPNHRAGNLDPDLIMENNIGAETFVPNMGILQASQLTVNLEEEEVAHGSDRSALLVEQIEARTDDNGFSQGEDQGPTSEPNCTTVDPDAAPSGSDREQEQQRGWKRGRRERGDDQFTKLASRFLEAVAAETAKSRLREGALLALEQHKHAEHVALERQKHSEQLALKRQKHDQQLAQAEKIAADVSAALHEVSASLRFFATEIARKM